MCCVQFKPSGITLTKNIRYENCDQKALMWHLTEYTGASWYATPALSPTCRHAICPVP